MTESRSPSRESNLADLVTAAIHLHPTAPLAQRVLLPGDPGRALLLAQSLLREPKMFNHNRGLWGHTGGAADDPEHRHGRPERRDRDRRTRAAGGADAAAGGNLRRAARVAGAG